MNSHMSMRTIAWSSSNRNSAIALVSSVLPTPVGPRNRNEPIGRFGSCRPARARRTALATARTASSWPTTRLRDLVFHAQQLVALAFQHLVDRDAGPARHDRGDVLGRDLFLDTLAALDLVVLGFLELLLELGDHAVGQLARLGQLALALRDLELGARLVELLLDLLRIGELVLLRLPLRRQLRRLLLELRQLLLEPLQPVARGLVALLLERFPLDLELDDAPVELVERLGLAVDLHAHAARRLVHQVDRLVGQEAVGDVAVARASRRRRWRRR